MGPGLKTEGVVGHKYSIDGGTDLRVSSSEIFNKLYTNLSGVTSGVGARWQGILTAPPKKLFSRSKN